jgi:hypothetical protein
VRGRVVELGEKEGEGKKICWSRNIKLEFLMGVVRIKGVMNYGNCFVDFVAAVFL